MVLSKRVTCGASSFNKLWGSAGSEVINTTYNLVVLTYSVSESLSKPVWERSLPRVFMFYFR